MAEIKYIIVHCSDSSFGNAALIAKWHIQKGWSGIGYHEVILNGKLSENSFISSLDGHLETGRPHDEDSVINAWEEGAHALAVNSNSIGVCLIGKSGKFTEKQMKKLEDRITLWRTRIHSQTGEYPQVLGHCDVESKKPDCPGFNVKEFVKRII